MCDRWNGTECKITVFGNHFKECGGKEKECLVIHDPVSILDSLSQKFREVTK